MGSLELLTPALEGGNVGCKYDSFELIVKTAKLRILIALFKCFFFHPKIFRKILVQKYVYVFAIIVEMV